MPPTPDPHMTLKGPIRVLLLNQVAIMRALYVTTNSKTIADILEQRVEATRQIVQEKPDAKA